MLVLRRSKEVVSERSLLQKSETKMQHSILFFS
jgi:hypothetical protein